MEQRDEAPKKPSNGQRKRRNDALTCLNTRSEDQNRAASLFDGCMQLFIAANFNSLLGFTACFRRQTVL